jgi:cation:H+ antiporter
MSLWLIVLMLVAGLVLLVKGADWLVDHAAVIAEALGIPHIVVGLTIVAFGTSSPELAAGIGSSIRGVGELALGAVVGSNIANVALILGTGALIFPVVSARIIRTKEVPLMLVAMLLGWGMMLGGDIGRIEGAVLLACIVAYAWHTYAAAQKEPRAFEHEPPHEDEIRQELTRRHSAGWWAKHAGLVLAGIAGLTAGAELLVRSTIELAKQLGVPEIVIGLTVVAVGTSLPELATSIRAAMKRRTDILLGNVIGSNVFNTLCVLGATALIRPIPVPRSTLFVDAAAMMGFGVLAWIMIATRKHIGKVEGAVLLAAYAGYVLYVVMSAKGVAPA